MPAVDVAVDVGRTHCRIRATAGDGRVTRDRSLGGAGLGDVAGPGGIEAVVRAAVRSAVGDPPPPWRLAVALPGTETGRGQADELAAALVRGWATEPGTVLVVSDSAAWQVGAFGGGDGIVLAVGTGAVAVSRRGGRVRRADGFGILLGDDGGGAWIGREALRAALRGHRGLAAAGARRAGPAAGWPGLLAEPDGAARLASLVPDVLALAGDGDPAAADILDGAGTALARTLDDLDPPNHLDPTADPDRPPVAVVGGLGSVLAARLAAASPGRRWVGPADDACAGAGLLLDRPDTPFEPRLVRRVAPSTPGGGGGRAPVRPAPTAAADIPLTEAAAPDTDRLDTWPTDRLVARLVAGQSGAATAVAAALPALTRAADLAAAALGAGGRLVYVGAGTPGRLAVQDAAELTPTFGLGPERVPVLLAGGSAAAGRAVEGAEDDVAAGAGDVDAAEVGPADVVVGISASGRTPYVLAALRRARERGAGTVGIASVPGSELSATADVGVELVTGPEVVAGSTRLAAGTAQKIALNTLSTAALVRLGGTFGPWMVDVRVTNAKLRRRAVRTVGELGRVTPAAAERALAEAGDSVKVALAVVLGGLSVEQARARLAATGSLRAVVEGGPGSTTAGPADRAG